MRLYARFIPYLAREWTILVLTLVSMAALSAATLARPWPLTFVVDSVLGGHAAPVWIAKIAGDAGKFELLAWAVAAMVVILFIAQALTLAQTYLSQLLGQRLVLDLRCDIYTKLQHLSLRFHDNRSVGDLIFRITGDAAALNDIVSHGLLPMVINSVTLGAVLVALFAMDVRLALISLIALPLLIANTVWFSGKIKGHSRGLAQADSNLYTKVSEVLGSIRAVKAFATEDMELDRFAKNARESQRAYVRIITLSALGGLMNEFFVGLAVAAVVMVGALIVMEGHLTIGQLLVFVAYLATLQTATTSLASCALVAQRSRASAERVIEILSEEDERASSGNRKLAGVEGELRFDKVSFSYGGASGAERGAALEDLSLTVAPGEMVALVGRSGAGKTTLLSLLLGFYQPQKGRILLDGVAIGDLDTKWLRRNVGLVLQDPIIFSCSLGENIGYGRAGATAAEIAAATAAAGLGDFVASLPEGYDTLVGERGARLSGGQRQRIGIARAFLKDAPILVLDEPTSNLDAATEKQVFDALARLAKGRTTLVVAHRLATARRADRIVILHGGRLAESGTHQQLLAAGGIYADLWRDQHEGPRPRVTSPDTV